MRKSSKIRNNKNQPFGAVRTWKIVDFTHCYSLSVDAVKSEKLCTRLQNTQAELDEALQHFITFQNLLFIEVYVLQLPMVMQRVTRAV